MMPKTRFVIAGNDPLRDQALELALRMVREGVNVKVAEMRLFPHAFLGIGGKSGIQELDLGLDRMVAYLTELAEN